MAFLVGLGFTAFWLFLGLVSFGFWIWMLSVGSTIATNCRMRPLADTA